MKACICYLDTQDPDCRAHEAAVESTHELDMDPDEYEGIRSEIWSLEHHDDRALFPACLDAAVSALGEIAVSSLTLEDAERVARNCLRQMVYRAKNGAFLHEMDHA